MALGCTQPVALSGQGVQPDVPPNQEQLWSPAWSPVHHRVSLVALPCQRTQYVSPPAQRWSQNPASDPTWPQSISGVLPNQGDYPEAPLKYKPNQQANPVMELSQWPLPPHSPPPHYKPQKVGRGLTQLRNFIVSPACLWAISAYLSNISSWADWWRLSFKSEPENCVRGDHLLKRRCQHKDTRITKNQVNTTPPRKLIKFQ